MGGASRPWACAQHLSRECANGRDGIGRAANRLERRERGAVAEPHRLRLGPFAVVHGPAAQTPLEEVGARPSEPRERRAQERVELAPAAAEPGKAEHREQRLAERCRAEPDPPLDRKGNAQRPEGRVERGAHALERRGHEGDLLRRRARLDEREDLLSDQLEGRPRARGLEEAHRAVEGDDFVGPVLEERPLEVRERRMSDVGERGRQLGRRPIREASEVGGRALERGERGPCGLVRQGDVNLGAAGERLEQTPLGTGQVLEPVGVHRLAVPGLEIAREPLDRPPPDEPSIPEPEPVELGAVGGCKAPRSPPNSVRLEQVPVELGERRRERLREPGEPCGASEPVQRREPDGAANEQRALRDTDQRPTFAVGVGDPLEQVVERADRAGQQRRSTAQQVALDAIDVRSVGHDEHRVAVERVQVAVEQQRHLAGVCRSNHEREPHSPIVVPVSDGSPSAAGSRPERASFSSAGDGRLRLAPASRDRLTGHRTRTVVAEIGLFCPAARIGVAHAHDRAFAFADLFATSVAN